MPVMLASYEDTSKHIEERPIALGPDLSIRTFDAKGRFWINGEDTAPENNSVDYVWLGFHINASGNRQGVLESLLRCKHIGVLQTFNSSLDDPVYKRISNKGVRICNSNAQAVGISEYDLAQVLGLFHPFEVQCRQQAEQKWQRTPYREISQTYWLIIGFGPIGQEVAKRLKAFGAGVSVVCCSPAPSELADKDGTMDDLNAFAAKADVVLLACSLNDAIQGGANADLFSAIN